MKHLLITAIAAMLLVGCGESQPPQTSMDSAAFHGDIEAIKQHLAAGTDVNEYTDGWTPLHQAAYQGYGDIVELLLSEGADVHAPLKHKLVAGKTAVDIAIISKHIEVADLLQKFGGKSSAKVSIFHAVELGDVEAVKKHLADGVGVDIKDEHGRTPLCLAVSSRDKETVQLLIDKGADVNFKMDVFGGTRTLLDIVIMESADMPTLPPDAFTMGSPGMPTLPDDFTSRGEPGDGMPSEAEVEQYTAKLWAEMYGTDKLKEIADLLRKHGAKTGNELLAEESILGAAGVGDNKLVEKHLADGADVNEKGNKGETPLHLAATKEVAELLIAKGAEVNEKDLDGETPLDWRIGMEFFPAFDPTEVNKNAKKVNDEITTLLRKHGGKTGDELRAEGK